MDSKVVKLLKIYENETGKDLLSKLTEDRLKKLGFYYENLSEDEQQDIDLKIITGEDNDFIDVCLGLSGHYDEVEYNQGLKDLTENVIEEEGGGSTALAVIPQTTDAASEEDLVGEDVDDVILRLLGLEDVVDIDYDTYKTLLKEKMMAGRMTDSQMPTEEVELLTDEYKRVKSKTGRFKVNKKTVSADSFFDRGEAADVETDKPVVTPAGLLPSAQKISKTVEEEQEAQVEEKDGFNQKVLAPSLQKIDENIQSILDTLRKQYDLEKKESDRDERLANKDKASKREAKLEGGKSKSGFMSGALNRIAKPVSDLFGMIEKFIINTLLGGLILRVMDIINDPHKYLNPIKQFFIDIIKWIESTVQFVVDIPYNMYNSIATGLNAGLQNIENAINDALAFFKQAPMDPGPRLPALEAPQIQIPIPGILKLEPTNAQQQVQQQTGGGEVMGESPMAAPVPIDIREGGKIESTSSNKIKGFGVDTQLVVAEPGEFMLPRNFVEEIGTDRLLAAVGGNNTAKYGSIQMPGMGLGLSEDIQTMKDGGAVSNLVISAGHAPTEENALKGIPLGSDGRSVQGTQDYGTGVNEWEATRHLVKTMQQIVSADQNLRQRISFQNIYSYGGLSGVPRDVEKNGGTQFVDIHFDARKNGRPGVIFPSSNNVSAVDRSMAGVFGKYPVSHKDYGVTAAGGTILEVDRIDSPAIAPFLGEVKNKTKGEHSKALARRVLNSMASGLSGAPRAHPTSSQSAPAIQSPQISRQKTLPLPPGAPKPPTIQPLYVSANGQSSQGESSSSGGLQKQVPSINPEDPNNLESLVVKSIYNIVG
jgi:hypothetical protein